MAKKEKKEKKKKEKEAGKLAKKAQVGPHEWTQVAAIQTLMRRIEAEAIERYMTVPAKFDVIQGILLGALDSLDRDPLFGCSRRPCPPGYYCCQDVCRAEPCDVGPNPKPPKPPKPKIAKKG